MPLVAARCTQCGADLQVDKEQEAAVCRHCGTAFVVDKAIQNYNTYVTQNFAGASVTITGADLDSLLIRAQSFLIRKEYDKAYEYSEKVLDIDPQCGQAYLISALAEIKAVTVQDAIASNKDEELLNNHNFKDALKYSDKMMMLQDAMNVAKNKKKLKDEIVVLHKEANSCCNKNNVFLIPAMMVAFVAILFLYAVKADSRFFLLFVLFAIISAVLFVLFFNANKKYMSMLNEIKNKKAKIQQESRDFASRIYD